MDAHCYIEGKWTSTTHAFDVADPATGEVVGTAADGGVEEGKAAVDAATSAFSAWSAMVASQRALVLRRIAATLIDDRDRIAQVIVAEQGKPRGQAAWEVGYAAEWLDWYAEEGRRAYGQVIPTHVPGKRLLVTKQPVGVALGITPWNFPVATIARKLAPALAAGCTLVIKPAEQTPLSAVALFEAIDRAGLPPGVANLVTSSEPEPLVPALTADPRVRKITFTGSTEVGKILVQASAMNLARISLELGGQAPVIVFDDADVDAAVDGTMAAKFQISGQSCLCANRIYVHTAMLNAFAERLAAAVRGLTVGRGSSDGVDVGPLIDERAVDKVTRHVDDAVDRGAKVSLGGRRLDGPGYGAGYFFEPTILTGCAHDMLVAREETFGPVLPLFAFEDEAEVLARANDSIYGLAAYVYTHDLGRALRASEALEYGIVGVNDPRPASPSAPFGGFKESGLGREGSHDGLEEFLETKLVSIVA